MLNKWRAVLIPFGRPQINDGKCCFGMAAEIIEMDKMSGDESAGFPAVPSLLSLSPSVGGCGAGPLQRRRITLFLHCDWLPDAERGAVIWGCVQPGEAGEALSSPQRWLPSAAAELQTLKLHYLTPFISIRERRKPTVKAKLTLCWTW